MRVFHFPVAVEPISSSDLIRFGSGEGGVGDEGWGWGWGMSDRSNEMDLSVPACQTKCDASVVMMRVRFGETKNKKRIRSIYPESRLSLPAPAPARLSPYLADVNFIFVYFIFISAVQLQLWGGGGGDIVTEGSE